MTPSVYYATLRIDLDHFQPLRPPAADALLATYRDFPVIYIQTVILLQQGYPYMKMYLPLQTLRTSAEFIRSAVYKCLKAAAKPSAA